MIIINRFSEKNVTDRVMFSQACVKNSVLGGGGGEVSVPGCTTGHMTGGGSVGETPPDRDPSPPYGNERAVRILLECILVTVNFDRDKLKKV